MNKVKKASDFKDFSISIYSLIELAECIERDDGIEHDGSTFKQLDEAGIGTKIAPDSVVILIDSMEEEEMLNNAFY